MPAYQMPTVRYNPLLREALCAEDLLFVYEDPESGVKLRYTFRAMVENRQDGIGPASRGWRLCRWDRVSGAEPEVPAYDPTYLGC